MGAGQSQRQAPLFLFTSKFTVHLELNCVWSEVKLRFIFFPHGYPVNPLTEMPVLALQHDNGP